MDKAEMAVMFRALAALSVLTIDPDINDWLSENDPNALAQGRASRIELFEFCRGMTKEDIELARS